MNQNENDNSVHISDDTLLRFLATVPRIRRNAEGSELSGACETEPGTSNCPEAGSYLRVAAGAAESSEAEKLLTHAATCVACADVLGKSLSVLEGNPSAEEAAAIAELAADRMEWQKKLAKDLAGTRIRMRPGLLRPGFRHPGRWLAGAAVAAGLIAAVALFVLQRRNNIPEHQLALAYSQLRTLELRVPDASYAGLAAADHTRGASGNREPAPLLEARARLARELERSPQNVHWLQLQARADVLGERYGAAVDVLDRLLATGPVTSDLLVDAASAYYQRGLVSSSELDRSTALDYLRRADELSPADPVVLFNEAIVMEDRGQMMNAVEVWNRYATVERDTKWAAEGKRKLGALEQTLNRLKTHQSRIRKMLATPQAMDALAADKQKLATLDEELSSFELHKLLQIAFPVQLNQVTESGLTSSEQARGSPCADLCIAARRLLKAIATSLEIEHHDFWLADLLSPDIDSLPATTAANYEQALRLLGQSMSEDMYGVAAKGTPMAWQSRLLFQKLATSKGAISSLAPAARAGGERAAFEYMYSLQRLVDFDHCRSFAQQLRARPKMEGDNSRYPWIEAQELETENVCDDTPTTRRIGHLRELKAMRLVQVNHYPLLMNRIQSLAAGAAQSAGDRETAERMALSALRELYKGDPPLIRVVYTIYSLPAAEMDSPRAYVIEGSLREVVEWAELAEIPVTVAEIRLELARAEIRIGAMKEAQNQLRMTNQDWNISGAGKSQSKLASEGEILLATSFAERGDLKEARHHLDRVNEGLKNYSDTWELRMYTSIQGQLLLSEGHIDEAAHTLETDIRIKEGRNLRHGDVVAAAEYAQQDRDLYAELAAVWLSQGRSPESVLALWERFRIRSRGLPVSQCQQDALDCEQPMLRTALHGLGNNILMGQILLMDRVLVYRADKNGVTWNQKVRRRQDVLDAAQTLERAVSSPFTSSETAARLGNDLTDALLPSLPTDMKSEAALLLEPDPMLQNLSWAVLPTATGPLGLEHPLAEVRSILIAPAMQSEDRSGSAFGSRGQALVVGASVAGQGEVPLPETLKEAQSVSRFLQSPDLLLGEQATEGRVAELLGSARIFHFAGHALQTQNGTELLLAAASPEDEKPWVDGKFLREHRPRACRLAVLSACATGRRDASWNHPLQDIVETLGSLGVPEVVATRWQIDSEASVPFMDAFYGSLAQGNSVAVALTSARRVQFGHSLYNNPFYWGAYYVTGRETRQLTGEFHASL